MTPPEVVPREVEELLAWLSAEKGRSPATLAAYRRDLARYAGWLADERGRTVLDATESDVVAHIALLRGEGKAPASVKRASVSVRSLHRFLVEEGHRADDPSAEAEQPRVPAGLPKPLSEEEVGRLLAAPVGDDPWARRDRAILEVLYATGIRVSELVGLSMGDLVLDDFLARVFGKGSKERIVPLGEHAMQALTAWLAPEGRAAVVPVRWARRGDAEAVFLGARGGRLSRQGAWDVLQRYGRQLGFADRLSPHVLRHSCATHMVDHGADVRVVQELLGHASVRTTQVYTKVSTERLWAAYRSAHPRAAALS